MILDLFGIWGSFLFDKDGYASADSCQESNYRLE